MHFQIKQLGYPASKLEWDKLFVKNSSQFRDGTCNRDISSAMYVCLRKIEEIKCKTKAMGLKGILYMHSEAYVRQFDNLVCWKNESF